MLTINTQAQITAENSVSKKHRYPLEKWTKFLSSYLKCLSSGQYLRSQFTRNELNEPTWGVLVEVPMTRLDNSLRLREELATGKSSNGDEFTITSVIGGTIALTLDVKRKDGTYNIYELNLKPMIIHLLGMTEELDAIDKIAPPARKTANDA